MLERRRSKLDLSPFYAFDAQRRKLLGELEQLQAARNKAAAEIGRIKSQKGDASALIQEMEASKGRTKELEAEIAKVEPPWLDLQLRINNMPDASAPIGASASDNKVLREVGKVAPPAFAPKSHRELGEALGILDFKAGAKL